MATSTIIGNVVTAVINRISDIKNAIGNATSTASGLMSAAQAQKLDGIADGANKTTVDSAMSSTSTNPVQNKVVNSAISALSSNLTSGKTVVEYANAFVTRGTDASWKDKEGMYYYEHGDKTTLDIPFPYCFVLHFSKYDGDTSRGVAICLRWANLGSWTTSTTLWVNTNHDGWIGWRAIN